MTTRGFTLIELLIAMAIGASAAGALLSLVIAGQSIARLQPEAADLQQRARIAAQVLETELARAGAGLDDGARAGPLTRRFAPLSPSADGGLTIWYVSDPAAQATLAGPLEPDAGGAELVLRSACAGSASACGFSAATTVLVFDDGGCHDLARVEAVAGAVLTLRAATRGCAYTAGASVALGEVRTYRVDAASRQLLRRDEATGVSVPIVDSVDGLTTEYLDGGRRIRLTMRFVPAVSSRASDLVMALDVRPVNLQEG